MCEVLRVASEALPRGADGRMDVAALEARLARGDVGTVVATLGTTGLGLVDPVHEIAELCTAHGARLHVDAAYGGFHTLLAGDMVDSGPFEAVSRADSIVVDPHKHGLQPYGCGCVLFADPDVGRLYAHDSPYTYFTSAELHLGEISLECSRAGAAAAALWTTLQALPLTRDGLGAVLAAGRAAALRVAAALASRDIALVVPPDLDIVCPFPAAGRASEISARCERAFATLAADGWHVAKLRVDAEWLAALHPAVEVDAPAVTTLRCCLMKPSHLDVADPLAAALAAHISAAAA
jgi:glutamate/tyrosine decarboxylase-like PLP-dependent enzyme